ncbi:MAG TPA: MBL fold metallo-hydrolase, partial [Tepidimicrobium sp.]|nr:MBL fold metallo-hydrolase [Tepidimicrobium sp.]
FGGLPIRIIHTPGHTPGSITINIENFLFTGDTLFAGSIGRTDFPEGSFRDIINSIEKKLLVYPDDTIVYPGHGPSSTIGDEKDSNPFIK